MSNNHASKLKPLVQAAKNDLSEKNIQFILSYIWNEVVKDIPSLSAKEIISGKELIRDESFPWTSYYISRHTIFLSDFANFGIPFNEWKDLASRALDLLEEQIAKPKTPMKELDGYQETQNMSREMYDRFSKDPRFSDAFRDPLSR